MVFKRSLSLSVFMIIVSVFIVSCSSAPVIPLNKLSDLPAEAEKNRNIKAEDYPESDAVVLYLNNETDVDYLPGMGFEAYHTYHVVTKVFRNTDQYMTVPRYLSDDFNLEFFAARTITPDGRTVELSERDIFMNNINKQSKDYNHDVKYLSFNFPSLEENSIVEFKFKVIEKGVYISGRWNIQLPIPVLESRFQVSMPKWLAEEDRDIKTTFQYKVYNYEKLEAPKIDAEFGSSGDKIYKWKASNIPAFRFEPNMGDWSEYNYHVDFTLSSWNEWIDVSYWYYNKKLKKQLKVTDKIKEKALELTKDKKSEIEKIKAIHRYVQSLNYYSGHLSYGHAIKPMAAEAVLERGYGDCKDKSTLMISLLESLDIKAKPVLVATADDGLVDTDVPSLRYFNHMIVRVITSDKKAYYADPTADYTPFGVIPWQDHGVDALIINRNGSSKIKRIPLSSWEDNNITYSATVDIVSEDSAKVNVTLKFKGQHNIMIRNTVADRNERALKLLCKDYIGDSFFNAEIYGISHSDPKDQGYSFELKFSFNADNMLQKHGDDKYYLNSDPFDYHKACENPGLEKELEISER